MTGNPIRRSLTVVVLGAAIITLPGCARQVTRIAPEQAIDLSGHWNDVDSRLVAEEMIEQSFSPAGGVSWATRFSQVHGGEAPTVIVGTIRNRSMEHVPVGTFVNDLERAYINSGMVRVVASSSERVEVRDERVDQQQFASATSRSRLRSETGADFMLQGDIQSIEDREGGESVVFYQVDLTLVNLETNEKVWVGQHKIKKFIDRPRFGF
ncbi:MAG TPA: penicillin-binding protein activator LpoB [Longimicrobiaceae bacterium]|nr:penicillin-binding protein activator LpoB [Longimicrobiaceae bacterium]